MIMYIHWSESQKRLVAYVAELRNYLVREMQVGWYKAKHTFYNTCTCIVNKSFLCFGKLIFVLFLHSRKNYNRYEDNHSMLSLVVR